MPQKIFTVFLSSTEEDLRAYREAVRVLIDRNKLLKCIAMENFGSQDSATIPFCKQGVYQSDFFVGIIGIRRGWEPSHDPESRSITEMEYDWATESNRPRFLCVAPDDFALPGHLRDSDAKYQRQQAFRSKVKADRIVGLRSFNSPAELAGDIISTLLTYVIAEDLVRHLRMDPDIKPDVGTTTNAIPAVAQALGQLAKDNDVDLAKLARDTGEIQIAYLEARLEDRAKDYERAAQHQVKAAGSHQENTGDARSRSALYWSHIGGLAFLHDTERALAAYRRAVELDPGLAESWRQLGWLQYRIGDRRGAEKTFDRLLQIGVQRDDKSLEAVAYHALGSVYRSRGELTAAESMYHDALRHSQRLGLKDGIADAYYGLGMIYRTRNDLLNAEKMQEAALHLTEELGRKERSADIYHSLGRIRQTRGEFAAAEQLFRKAMQISQEAGYQVGIGNALLSLGSTMIELEQLNDAENALRSALKVNECLKRKDGIARSFLQLGLLSRRRRQYDIAMEMQQMALDLFQDIDRKEGIAGVYSQMGDTHADLGDIESACSHLKRACALYSEMTLQVEVKDIEARMKMLKCCSTKSSN